MNERTLRDPTLTTLPPTETTLATTRELPGTTLIVTITKEGTNVIEHTKVVKTPVATITQTDPCETHIEKTIEVTRTVDLESKATTKAKNEGSRIGLSVVGAGTAVAGMLVALALM